MAALAACGGGGPTKTGVRAARIARASPVRAAQIARAPTDPQPYPVRGIYDRDSSKTGFNDEAALGFNYVDSGPYIEDMRLLAAHHLKGLVWLGGYSNVTCTFEKSDAWVRSHVSAIAGSPAVGAYYISDEPNAADCPNAPAQTARRAALVKSIDPGPPTMTVTYHVDQLKLFAGTVDLIGLDPYPCSRLYGCRYSLIGREVAEADRLGIRYWGIIQAAGDNWYALPTPQELHEEFMIWRRTRMEGYLVFAWRWPQGTPSLWLANHPALQGQLAIENAQ